MTSRSPSPMRFTASANKVMTPPGGQGPPDEVEGGGDVEQCPGNPVADGEGQDEKRHGEEVVRHPHEDLIAPLSHVARDDPEERPDCSTHEDNEERDGDVNSNRFHNELK